MRILGLPPQADEDAIRNAYREKAKKWHPDMYSTPAEKGVATKRIKQLNNARDYVLRHRDTFVRQHATAAEMESDRTASGGLGSDDEEGIFWTDVFPDNEVVEFLLIPVFAVYSIAFAVAMTPLAYIYESMEENWEERGHLYLGWAKFGPYLVMGILPWFARDTGGAIWFWSAFGVVLGAEALAQLMGWWIQRSNRSDIEAARRYIESTSGARQIGE